MKENKVSGKSLIVVTLALMVGTVIVLTLMVLNRKDASPPSSTSVAAEVPAPHMLKFPQIREWILKEMAAKGAKLSVVNIWATWCEPCRAEMPELAKFAQSGNAPLFLVSADNESDIESVRAFLGESKANFQTSLIAGAQDEFIMEWQKLTESLKTPWSMTLPATFLVTDTGEIRAMLSGEKTESELRAFVAKHQDAKR
ncbi:MAG: TlpA family protein disulfide reductase [Bdellovibrionaceae bacterium]|nr:TlpA family protein disulfide reductase [Pseudobdellovibrionaceae bacterium]